MKMKAQHTKTYGMQWKQCWKGEERSQISNLTLHLKKLKKEQNKPKATRKKEIVKIRAMINKIETRN